MNLTRNQITFLRNVPSDMKVDMTSATTITKFINNRLALMIDYYYLDNRNIKIQKNAIQINYKKFYCY
jgi:hypothetical protein